MLLGYIRIGTQREDAALQRSRLLAAGCDIVFEETAARSQMGGSQTAGSQTGELDRLLGQVNAGDVIVVTALQQLARSTANLLEVAHRLRDRHAGLRSLGEAWADTTLPAGWMVLTVLAGMAQFEGSLRAQRRQDGRGEARERGVRFGRPSSLAEDQVAQGRELVRQGTSVRRAAALIGCHYASLYRALSVKDADRTAAV